MMNSDEIREIQRIIMGCFRQARHQRNNWKAHYYVTLHTHFHERLAATCTLEMLDWDLAHWCDGRQEWREKSAGEIAALEAHSAMRERQVGARRPRR